jgi:hypothetical protein
MRSHLLLLLAASCTAPPPPEHPTPPGYRGPHASEHLEQAQDQERLAREGTMWPDTRPYSNGRVDQPVVAMPWQRSWTTPESHEQLAQMHRAAAAELNADFQRACADHTPDDIARSPIERFGIGGVSVADGVIVFLAPEAGPAHHLLADVACHRAWMMLSPANMEGCALDLDGIQVDAMGDEAGITLRITERDPALVPELQRRAAKDLEQRASH